MISSAYNLSKYGLQMGSAWEFSCSPFLLLKHDLSRFPVGTISLQRDMWHPGKVLPGTKEQKANEFRKTWLDQQCFQRKILVKKKEMWKLIKKTSLRWSQEARRGKLWCHTTWLKSCQLQTTRPPQRRILNRKESSVTGPKRERCTLHLLQEISYPSNSAIEKPSLP